MELSDEEMDRLLKSKTIKKGIKNYMSELGKRGKGESKRRGDSEYYRRLSRLAVEKRERSGYTGESPV